MCVTILLLLGGAVQPLPLRATARGYDWLQFDGNAQHNGTNGWETTITTRNVGRLRRLFYITLPSFIDGAPVYMRAVPTRHGLRNLLFATTYSGAIFALDARTGDTLWSHQNGTRQRCPAPFWKHAHLSEPCYTYSSAAIDPNRRFVYSYGLDGYMHKYALSSGTEITGRGWPELVTRKPAAEKESSALSVATARNGTNYLYVTTSSYGDAGDYQGHLTTISLTSGTQHVFNAVCSDQIDVHFAAAPSAPDCPTRGAGIWARAGVVYVRATDRIYLATGNGTFAPARHAWGESVVTLHPDGTGVRGAPLDSYTPANYAALNATDHDLGSAAPAIVPTLAHSRIRHLAVQGDKDGTLRLLNLDNLSGHGGPGDVGGDVGTAIPVPQGAGVLAQPVVWVNPRDSSTWVFVGTALGLSGLRLTVDAETPRSWGGTARLTPMWSTTTITGTSPLVANTILYSASSGHIRALDPTSGRLLWQDTSIGPVHMSSPIVANGVLYVADESHGLTAYAVTRQGMPAAGPAR